MAWSGVAHSRTVVNNVYILSAKEKKKNVTFAKQTDCPSPPTYLRQIIILS